MPGDENGTPEPRRSGRSTKGQHTRNAELNEEAAAKKKASTPTPVPTPGPPTAATKKTTKATTRSSRSKKNGKGTATSPTGTTEDDSEDGEIIRCVCGADTDEGGRQMIQCDNCNAWQHSSCMQIPTKNTPAEYYCEQCKPELHKDLLERMARGEKPWERRGRKGTRKSVGRASSKKKEGESEAPETPAPEEQGDEKNNDVKMDSPAPTATTAEAGEEPAEDEEEETKAEQDEQEGEEAEEEEREEEKDTAVQNLEEVLDPALKSEEKEDVPMKEEEVEEAPEENTFEKPAPPAEGSRRRSSVASQTTLKRKAEEIVEEESADGKEQSPTRRSSVPQSPTQAKGSKTRSGRRSSTTTKPPPMKKPKMADNQLEQVTLVEDLKSDTRRKGVETLKKFLEGSLKPVEELPEGETSKPEFATRLALEIEHYTYILLSSQTAGEPNDEYRQKFRSILFNLKKNEPLLNNLLSKKIGTKEFSDMTGDEMATEDMKHIVQEAEKESEKQSIMTAEAAGPRIRRTHKGEEIVGEDTSMIADNSTGFIGSRYEPPAEKSDDERSAPPSPGADDHVMTDRPRSPSPTANQEPAETPTKALKIDTSKPASGSGHHRRTSSFDIQNVWSNVESTDAGHRQSIPRPPVTPLTAHPANGNNAQLDRDIDMLLQNDGTSPGAGSETPPYSPKDYMDEMEEGVIWKGKMLMRGVADLDAQATHVAGPDLSARVPWSTVIGNSIEITGRISVDRANEYLQQLRYSSRSSDVVVFALQASSSSRSSDSSSQFDKLYNHFKERQRSGVVGNLSWAPTKDVYVVAVAKDEVMPKHMLNTQFPANPREKDTLLLCIVFNRSLEPFMDNHTPTTATAQYTPVPPSRALQTPVTVAPNQQQGWQPPPQANPAYTAYQQSPTPANNYSSAGIPSLDGQYNAPGLQHRSPITLPSSAVINNAQNPNVLDELMRILQLGPADQAMLKDIIEKNPESAGNPEQLMQLVQQYHEREHGRRV
ncbi:hypothetical protein H072_11495 [Dactylellina haptotyla CBS 200.50]|uniref:Transcription factor BYE1 n=1 Tax=Dactylellina haptotyla (strain CBS 200.50) TaxID=1284197 RepID=S8BIY8_DACHA|nr:hypothetical protein H072_11495 [Dactylellina haptotyla CBS 200.50]